MVDASAQPESRGGTVASALAVAAVAACVLALAPPAGSLDDAFVVLVEARGWVEGAVRPSGAVEGATSPLDVLCKAALMKLRPEADPLRDAGWLGLVWLGALVALVAGALRRWGARGALHAALCLGAVTAPGVLESASYRLEGPLFALAWAGLVIATIEGRFPPAVAWAAVLAWARPEGLLLGPAALWMASTGPEGRRVRHAVLGSALAVLPVTAWRLATYGDVVPNTFHAKRSDRWQNEWMDGATYALEVLASPGGVAVALVAGSCLALLRRSDSVQQRPTDGAPPPRRARSALALSLVALGILVASGGDGYRGARLALPVGLPLWLAASSLAVGARPWARAVVGAALLLQLAGGVTGPVTGANGFGERLAAAAAGPTGLEVFSAEEEALTAASEALGGEVFAHRHLQRLRWFSPGATVLDLTGLTDGEVARRPAPGPVAFGRDAVDLALERRVGALHLDPVGVRPQPLAEADLVRALADPRVAGSFGGEPFLERSLAEALSAEYVGASRAVPGGHVNLLIRRDLAPRFSAAGFSVGSR